MYSSINFSRFFITYELIFSEFSIQSFIFFKNSFNTPTPCFLFLNFYSVRYLEKIYLRWDESERAYERSFRTWKTFIIKCTSFLRNSTLFFYDSPSPLFQHSPIYLLPKLLIDCVVELSSPFYFWWPTFLWPPQTLTLSEIPRKATTIMYSETCEQNDDLGSKALAQIL
jgi:hypothetical protein